MVALTEKDIEGLDEYLYPDFGGYRQYRKLVTNRDILRLLTFSGDIEIVRPWNVYLRLVEDYNHLEYKPIEIYDTDFKLIAEFESNSVFGLEEHIDWLLTREHGSQFYLKIYTANSINTILCIVVREVAEFERRAYIERWLEEIKWSITRPNRIEALLSFNTNLQSSTRIFNIQLVYLPQTDYINTLSLDDVLSSPDSIVTNLAVDTYLTLTSVKGGYYAIGLVKEGNIIDWLKINLTNNTNKYIYRFNNGLNYLRLNNNQSYTVSLLNDNIYNIENVLEGELSKIYTDYLLEVEFSIEATISEFKDLFSFNNDTAHWLLALHYDEPTTDPEWYLSNRFRVTTFTITTWATAYPNTVTAYSVGSNQYLKSNETWVGVSYYSLWKISTDTTKSGSLITKGVFNSPLTINANEYLKITELIINRE